MSRIDMCRENLTSDKPTAVSQAPWRVSSVFTERRAEVVAFNRSAHTVTAAARKTERAALIDLRRRLYQPDREPPTVARE